MSQRFLKIALLFAAFCLATGECNAQTKHKKNVLFIAVDDLRPELGCYGKQHMNTPNFDSLAKRGVLFENAYCMVPTCGASRASVMSSRRPAPDRFKNYLTMLSQDAPDATPLHTQFKNNGYTTISIGKIFHHAKDHADGWSETPTRGKSIRYFNRAAQKKSIAEHKKNYPNFTRDVRGPATESFDHDGTDYGDGISATAAIEKLEQFSQNQDQPFFLALGFEKPHLPFIAPKKYWDMYDRSEIKIADNKTKPTDVPKFALHTSGELRAYSDIPPKGSIDDEKAKELIHGYRACVSFIDAQLGRVLAKLEETGMADNTIVVLWSDHGWQLGEHGLWNKHSCFETSMWTPLIIAAPGDQSVRQNKRAAGIVELIDLYPTICDLAGVEHPKNIDGESLLPMLQDPTAAGKPFAIGRYKSGDTIRTKDFRYTEFRGRNDRKKGKGPNGMGSVIGQMLFNHASDPNENENVAEETRFAEASQRLSADLNANKGKPFEK